MKTIKLTDLEGEIMNLQNGDSGGTTEGVWFVCPVCLDANGGKREGVHGHFVPFVRGQAAHGQDRGRHIWGHTGGSTADDITLTPSYLALSSGPRSCRLHAFIRGGVLQVLGDSHGPGGAA